MPDVSEGLIALVTVIAAAIGNKLWNKASDKSQSRIDAALETASSLMEQLAMTMSGDTPVDRLIRIFKGVVSVQLAKVNPSLKIDHPLVAPFVDAAIAAAVKKFIAIHPAPSSLRLPIMDKIPITPSDDHAKAHDDRLRGIRTPSPPP